MMRHEHTDREADGPDPDAQAPGGADAATRSALERPELDPDEGADAFETLEESREGEHRSGAEREDEDHISMDPPD